MSKSSRLGMPGQQLGQRRVNRLRKLSRQQFRLKLETLESRQLLSATFGLPTGDADNRLGDGSSQLGTLPDQPAMMSTSVPGELLGVPTTPQQIPLEPAEAVAQEEEFWRTRRGQFNGGLLAGDRALGDDSGDDGFGRMNDGGGDGGGSSRPDYLTLPDTFLLHSKPDATKTIFLDFDGFVATGTPWNSNYNTDTITSPAYDPAGDGDAFSDWELARIQEIWHRVAEDFAPFDVNVTTEDPGEDALVNTGGSDSEWGIRVVMTVDNFASCGCGGFAFINSFNWGYGSVGATDTPAYVFNVGAAPVALAITHEVGHAIGLSHDGTTSANPVQPGAAYYFGHGSGETGWGPIMGAPYSRNVLTWDIGEYVGANNGGGNANYGRGPDDLTIITTYNGFDYRVDDHGDSMLAATEISYDSTNAADPEMVDVSMFGIVSTPEDVDYIEFVTGGGIIDLTINSYVGQAWVADGSGSHSEVIEDTFFTSSWAGNQASNLDILATLYDASGAVVATSNPTGLSASFNNLDIVAGLYYLAIEGTGFGNPADSGSPTGYTDYGSLGQYQITGTLVQAGGPLASASVDDIMFRTPEDIEFDVIFTDRDGVDVATLGTGDIRVVGPGGYDELATFIGVDDDSTGTQRVATYSIPAPNGIWDADVSGTYTISLEAEQVADIAGNFNEPGTIATFEVDISPTIGPDGFGYVGYPLMFDFQDISQTGTLVLEGVDDGTALIAPGSGFEFSYYGTNYDELHVSSNGLITFGAAYSFFDNTDLTSAPDMPSFAVLWDDLAANAGGGVFWELVGTGAEQKLILQWETQYFGANDPISFQAVLDEADMSLSVHYANLWGGSSEGDEGGSATLGIKDDGQQGANRLVASFDTFGGGYVATGRAMKFLVANNAPTSIELDPAQNTENSPVGTWFGTLFATDADAGDTHTFELVAGAGDQDNGRFEIVGSELRNLEVLDYEMQSTYTIRVRATDSLGEIYETDMLLAVQDLAEVDEIVIGDGTDQRSRVDQVQVVFDGDVTIDADAFTVNQRGGGGVVTTDFTTALDGQGRTVATITFSGDLTRAAGALLDGNYDLLIDATKVSRNGLSLDGDQDGLGGGDITHGDSAADGFFAMYGDTNGDRSVDLIDFLAFRDAFDSVDGDDEYDISLDYDGMGAVNLTDFLQFRSRFGNTLDFE
ncbi:cadherin domain-containing protein [Planctomycetaceae bacterium SH139]